MRATRGSISVFKMASRLKIQKYDCIASNVSPCLTHLAWTYCGIFSVGAVKSISLSFGGCINANAWMRSTQNILQEHPLLWHFFSIGEWHFLPLSLSLRACRLSFLPVLMSRSCYGFGCGPNPNLKEVRRLLITSRQANGRKRSHPALWSIILGWIHAVQPSVFPNQV